MKRGRYMSNLGLKGQSSSFRLLSGCVYFLTRYLNTSWSVVLPTLYTDSGWYKKDPQKMLGQLSLIKVSCPKALDNLADFSVLSQVGRFTYAFCYQFLVIFRCFDIFPLDRIGFFTFKIPGCRDIVQVVQTVQINLQNFRFTEPGSNLASVLKNIANNFYIMQKGNVFSFYKIIYWTTLQRFFLGLVYLVIEVFKG